jgi:uncharacterized protein
MKCPKCSGSMIRTTFASVEVDRCATCKGLWFDEHELQVLLKKEGSERIDTGTQEHFKKSSQIDDVWCPRDNSRLIKMVHPRQNHVWFESCSQCFGLFLDATEFKDLKESSLADMVRSMAVSQRKA